MKKILLISIPLFFLGLAAHAFAATNIQGFTALAPITGLTDTNALSVVNSNGLASFFNNLYKFAIGLAAALAVIQIIWAGLDIAIFHKDAVGAITDDKGKIYNAVFGLVLVLSPILVFSIINPSILNLSLNLPALNTTSGAPVQQTCTGNGTNCVTNTGSVLTTGSKYVPCADSTCAAEIALCGKQQPANYTTTTSIVCVKSDGTIDPSGVAGQNKSIFGNSISACITGEKLSVSCSYSAASGSSDSSSSMY